MQGPAERAESPSPPDADGVWDGAETLLLGDGSACTIVAIHGYGASPGSLKGLYVGMPIDAVVVLPRGPIPRGNGAAWFMRRSEADEAAYAQAIGAAADRLAEGIRSGVPGAKASGAPLVTGFSQGGMVSWTLTARHPELVKAAFPVGGLLPVPLHPTGPNDTPVHAFHGDADRVVPFALDEASVAAAKAQGWQAELHPYAGVGHTIPSAMRAELAKELTEACR